MLSPSRMQQSLMPQRTFEGRLHLHGAKLLDGEVQVPLGLGLLPGVAGQQQLRDLQTRMGEVARPAGNTQVEYRCGDTGRTLALEHAAESLLEVSQAQQGVCTEPFDGLATTNSHA